MKLEIKHRNTRKLRKFTNFGNKTTLGFIVLPLFLCQRTIDYVYEDLLMDSLLFPVINCLYFC